MASTMPPDGTSRPTSRRDLLKWGLAATALAAMPTALAACSDEDVPTSPTPTPTPTGGVKTITLGVDDISILNFALLLEELEAAFYTAAVASNKFDANSPEQKYMVAIKAHEVAHVSFLRTVLGNNAKFTSAELASTLKASTLATMLASQQSILQTAMALEDTGVHAYNGAGPYLKNATYLLAAGSIVSIEARHAAAIRALLGLPSTEADSNGGARVGGITDGQLKASDNLVKGRPYDELYTPKQVLGIVLSLNVLDTTKIAINGALVA